MFESNSLSALELRRRLLLAESELNRLTLRQGLTDLREHTRWINELRTGTPRTGAPSTATSWLTMAAPAAGLLAARALLKRGTVFGRISGLIKMAAVAYPVIRAWQRHRHQSRKTASSPD